MTAIKAFLARFERMTKVIFFISVTILVLVGCVKLTKTISLAEVQTVLSTIPSLNLLAMLVIGLVAVLPMIGYDLVLNQLLANKVSKRYLFETSWAINTINNLVGFAGLVDVGLRYSFYAKEGEAVAGTKVLSKVIPYFMAGLSGYSFIALLMLVLSRPNHALILYWPLLLGLSLYLPVIYLISSRQSLTYFGQLGSVFRHKLVLTSLLEWTGVILSFIAIGRLAGYQLPVAVTIPIFMIAMGTGMLSMLPGGLGGFDLVLIAGLTSAGLSSSQAVSWLLLHRLFYDVIPFLLGLLFFSKHMGARINDKFLGLPATIARFLAHQLELAVLRLFGFFFILSALIPDDLHQLGFLSHLDPIHSQLIWQFPSIVLGVLVIILARAIQDNVKRAFPIGLGVILVSLVYVNLGSPAYVTSAFLIVCLLILLALRSSLSRQRFRYGWESLAKDTALVSLAMGIYIVFNRRQWQLLTFDSLRVEHYIWLWLEIGLATLFLVLLSRLMFYFLSDRSARSFGESLDEERYQALLSRFDAASDSGLVFLNDKRLYWFQDAGEDQVVFQFAIESNKCVVMAEPIGNPQYISEAIGDFIQAARQENLDVIFYEVGKDTTLTLHEFGYDFMKFGESALVDLASFTTEGKAGRKFRTIVNKLEKQGYNFTILAPPFTEETLDRLEEISASWLGHRQEKGFSLGFFDRTYLQRAPLALVKDSEGTIIAFANLMPGRHDEIGTIDLMRYDSSQTPNGVMDYLFVKLMGYFKEAGKPYFDLGMAPLSNVGNLDHSFIQEKLAYLIYTFTNHFYSFSGLRAYKQKFRPSWHPRYIAYPKWTWLLFNMIIIFKIDNRKIKADHSAKELE